MTGQKRVTVEELQFVTSSPSSAPPSTMASMLGLVHRWSLLFVAHLVNIGFSTSQAMTAPSRALLSAFAVEIKPHRRFSAPLLPAHHRRQRDPTKK
ncbi:hypothetical protein F2Q69_00054486 [Brassica cretica]|uniref:Uncharacterized protein n=1 Tax=Brassica cretica TaxID=69181 RepID=A0A8S9N6M0_BRACR|nr:hypothetical protein F2Q69_00054486 [Brassica cretica]